MAEFGCFWVFVDCCLVWVVLALCGGYYTAFWLGWACLWFPALCGDDVMQLRFGVFRVGSCGAFADLLGAFEVGVFGWGCSFCGLGWF